jgi:hypothetical protein
MKGSPSSVTEVIPFGTPSSEQAEKSIRQASARSTKVKSFLDIII